MFMRRDTCTSFMLPYSNVSTAWRTTRELVKHLTATWPLFLSKYTDWCARSEPVSPPRMIMRAIYLFSSNCWSLRQRGARAQLRKGDTLARDQDDSMVPLENEQCSEKNEKLRRSSTSLCQMPCDKGNGHMTATACGKLIGMHSLIMTWRASPISRPQAHVLSRADTHSESVSTCLIARLRLTHTIAHTCNHAPSARFEGTRGSRISSKQRVLTSRDVFIPCHENNQ